MDKKQVAAILNEIGELLEIKGENPFKSRAYYNAARTLERLDEDLGELVRSGRLADLKGFGKALVEKVGTLVTTGALPYHENLRAEFPPGLFDMMRIPGLGPRKLGTLYRDLGAETLGELKYACHENRLVSLPGFGLKSQENVLAGIEYLERQLDRYLCAAAREMCMPLAAALESAPGVARVSRAGAIRRGVSVVEAAHLLAAADNPREAAGLLTGLESLAALSPAGEDGVTAVLETGLRVEVRFASDARFPFALLHHTGSTAHLEALRRRAEGLGFALDEEGLFAQGSPASLAILDEGEIYERLGLPFIPPELREGAGEIEAAASGALPALVQASDIRGVLHAHTTRSDGSATLEELAREAARLGYAYLGIADHSRSSFYAGGLGIEEILEQWAEIDAFNAGAGADTGVLVLKGTEADILPDGALDYPDDILEGFDFVIASVHSNLCMERQAMTRRLIRAVENPHVDILGHPTGRILLARPESDVDLDAVITAAARNRTALELNAHPSRLDLGSEYLRAAREAGVLIAINPDAHSAAGLADTAHGVVEARRGWLAPGDVLNTRGWKEIRAWRNRE